jgi:hypothetical protein
MQLLLARDADLEALNEFDGTVLSSTIWFAYHVKSEEFTARNFPQTLQFLIDAGGRTDYYPDMLSDIAGVLLRAKRAASAD